MFDQLEEKTAQKVQYILKSLILSEILNFNFFQHSLIKLKPLKLIISFHFIKFEIIIPNFQKENRQ